MACAPKMFGLTLRLSTVTPLFKKFEAHDSVDSGERAAWLVYIIVLHERSGLPLKTFIECPL